MIAIAIDRMPPPDVMGLEIGDPVLLTLEDAAYEAYLTRRTPFWSMPIVTGPETCAVLYQGVMLSFSMKNLDDPNPFGYEPPIYSCVVPAP